MTVYEVVNATVVRRRRDAADKEEDAQKRREKRRRRPATELADQVTSEFRKTNQVGRRTGSTR